MLVTRRQLRHIINTGLNESILLSLLIGCQSECNLYSIAPELKNLKIPECVTEDPISIFNTIDWDARDLKVSDFVRLVEAEGYRTKIRRGAFSQSVDGGEKLHYDDIAVTIPNVPCQLIQYAHDNRQIKPVRASEINAFKRNELRDLTLYFIIAEIDGVNVVLKNSYYTDMIQTDGSEAGLGHASYAQPASDSKCNDDFKAVVDNIDPQITPEEEDTGY